jgi:hypothetical protein
MDSLLVPRGETSSHANLCLLRVLIIICFLGLTTLSLSVCSISVFFISPLSFECMLRHKVMMHENRFIKAEICSLPKDFEEPDHWRGNLNSTKVLSTFNGNPTILRRQYGFSQIDCCTRLTTI